MTAVQTRDGVDITVDLTPDTPAAWGRLTPAMYSAVDRLASAAAATTTDWTIAVHLGPNTVLTAGPATKEHA